MEIKELLFISQGLKMLSFEELSGAALKYEYGLEKEFSKYYPVSIYTMGLPSGVIIQNANIKLIGIMKDSLSPSECIYQSLKMCSINSVCIFWNYDLRRCLAMRRLQKERKLIVIPIIYDDYHAAVESNPFWKKRYSQLYFEMGKAQIKHFDGCILFQNAAAKELKLQKAYLISKPGVLENKQIEKFNQDKFIAVYIGTLRDLNGIRELLDSVQYICEENFELHLYGDGPLTELVKEYAANNSKIKYFGRVNQNEIMNIYEKASLNICLRDLSDCSMKFAFPSKLFECMYAGIPTLTTRLLPDPEFDKSVVIVPSIDAKNIAKSICYIAENGRIASQIGENGKKYVEKNFMMSELVQNINSYICDVYRRKLDIYS